MKRKFQQVLVFLFCALLFQACNIASEPEFDNPNDPLNPHFESPEAEVTYPTDQFVVTTPYVTFTWVGVHNGSSFSYKLENFDDDFSSWSTSTSTAYNYLDEGSYIFYIKEKYGPYEQTVASVCHITVDALLGTSLIFNKYYNKVHSNQESSIDIDIENIEHFKGITTQVEFGDGITITNIEKVDDDLEQNGSNLVLLTNAIEEINQLHKLHIDGVLLGGASDGFSGSATFCRIYYKATANAQFSFISDSTQLRDYENQNIAIQIYRNGNVTIY